MTEARGYKWKNVGARIREARTKAGFTQRQLSELLGVSSHTVWCWEAGRMKPAHERLGGTCVPVRCDHGLATGTRRCGGGGSQGDGSFLQGRRFRPTTGRSAVDPGVHPVCEGESEEEEEDQNRSMSRAQRKASELRRDLRLHGRGRCRDGSQPPGDGGRYLASAGPQGNGDRRIYLCGRAPGCWLEALGDSPRHWSQADAPRQPHVDTIPHRIGASLRAGKRRTSPVLFSWMRRKPLMPVSPSRGRWQSILESPTNWFAFRLL